MKKTTNLIFKCRKEFEKQTSELIDEISALIREKMRIEFENSNSITPGLQDRIDEEYAPIFKKIFEFEENLTKVLNFIETHAITVAKNYALAGLTEVNASEETRKAVRNIINRLSATTIERHLDLPKGALKSNIY